MHTKHTKIKRVLHCMIGNTLETNEGQLRRVPNHILGLTLFVCVSVLAQGFADVALKLVSYGGLLPEMPWRTDFLFLTAISVLMGYRTYAGMHHRKFDVTRNSIELGVLVEVALVVGDTQFIYMQMADVPHVLFIRLPFIVLTGLNIIILLYNYHALCLRKWWCGTQ